MRELWEAMPFTSVLGADLVAADPEAVSARLAWSERLCTAGGLMHGGAIMGLADSCGGLCAFLNLPPDSRTATVESSTRLLRGVRGGAVTAVARPLHAGSTVIVVETEVHDDDGRLVAKTTQTQAVLPAQRRNATTTRESASSATSPGTASNE